MAWRTVVTLVALTVAGCRTSKHEFVPAPIAVATGEASVCELTRDDAEGHVVSASQEGATAGCARVEARLDALWRCQHGFIAAVAACRKRGHQGAPYRSIDVGLTVLVEGGDEGPVRLEVLPSTLEGSADRCIDDAEANEGLGACVLQVLSDGAAATWRAPLRLHFKERSLGVGGRERR